METLDENARIDLIPVEKDEIIADGNKEVILKSAWKAPRRKRQTRIMPFFLHWRGGILQRQLFIVMAFYLCGGLFFDQKSQFKDWITSPSQVMFKFRPSFISGTTIASVSRQMNFWSPSHPKKVLKSGPGRPNSSLRALEFFAHSVSLITKLENLNWSATLFTFTLIVSEK